MKRRLWRNGVSLLLRFSLFSLFLITTGLIPRSFLHNGDSKSFQGPSFPHAFSGNPGETRTGPPIKTFGGDDFGANYHKVLSIPLSLLRGSSSFFSAQAAELPAVRITQAIINEKSLALWIGVEQGFFRKHGVSVEIIQTRSSAQTLAALASGDIQIAGTTPSVVLSAVVGGMDVAFFGGIVNRADGDFVVAPGIRTAEDLRGKKLGVQSLGGGVWSLAMLALDHLGLEPTRDKILVIAVGDQSVLVQALATGRIDATYLGYTYSALLKEKGFPVLLDIGRASIPYQGLALVARRSYLKQNPRTVDAILRGVIESVAFIQNPAHREVALKSLAKNLRLTSTKEAESGYEVLQWLYSLDVKPSVTGIQNMQRLLAMTNPRVAGIKAEDVVDEGPVQRVEKTSFYQELLPHNKK